MFWASVLLGAGSGGQEAVRKEGDDCTCSPAVGLGLSSPIAPEVRADQWGLLGSRIKSFPRQLIIQAM